MVKFVTPVAKKSAKAKAPPKLKRTKKTVGSGRFVKAGKHLPMRDNLSEDLERSHQLCVNLIKNFADNFVDCNGTMSPNDIKLMKVTLGFLRELDMGMGVSVELAMACLDDKNYEDLLFALVPFATSKTKMALLRAGRAIDVDVAVDLAVELGIRVDVESLLF